MTTEPHKKTPRSFHCRDALWQKFEQMAKELECSVDYLINDAMKQYVRQRGYAGPGSTLTNMSAVNPGSVPPPAPTAAGTTAPPAAAAPPPPPPPPAPALKQPPAPPPPATHGTLSGTTTTGSHAGPPPPPPHLPPTTTSGSQAGRLPTTSGSQAGRLPTTSGSQAGHLPKPAPAPPPPARAFPPPPATGGGAPLSQAGAPTQRVPPLGTSPGSRNVPPLPRQAPPPLPTQAAPSPAPNASRTLSVRYEGQVFPITKDRFVIGRGKNASDLTIKDPNVSRQHALVEFSNGQYYIVDMGSTNGVEFKGSKVQRKVIDDGDTVRVCEHELTFSFSG